MNVLMNLISLYNHLLMDSTYRSVIKEILNHLESMADATIFDVAEITASSRTTIWRMIKMLGYDSYSEFHHELKKIITQYSYYNWSLPVSKESNNKEVIHMASELLAESGKLVKEFISEQLLIQIVEHLYKADHISFYDFPSTSVYFLIQNLAMSGKSAGVFNLWPEMLADAKYLTCNSVVFAYPIEAQDMKDLTPVLKLVKKNKATLILGSLSNNRYGSYADYSLFPSKLSLTYPLSIRYAFEMLLMMISELYRIKYIL